MINNIQISDWIENPTIEEGWEHDFWRDAEIDDPYAKHNPDTIWAFLWIKENIGIIKTDQE